MEKEFIPYKQALILLELGFNEECYKLWRQLGMTNTYTLTDEVRDSQSHFNAPTFSQAFRWFREKYNIEHNNRPVKKFDTDKSREISFYIDGYFISNLRFTTDKTHEEAELECLKKLIEIVKTK